jgi:hypothetical protein
LFKLKPKIYEKSLKSTILWKAFHQGSLCYPIMEPKELYDKIMGIDPQIRFATIASKDGKIEHTGHREGVTNVLTPDESKKSLQRAIDSWNARNDLSDKIGEGKYVLAEYAKIKRITIPYGGEHLVYLTTDVQADHTKIIAETLKLL